MAIIPPLFMNAAVSIGLKYPNKDDVWIGTGFIVGRKEKDNPRLSTYYIITNKHVVKGEKKIFVRFNATEGDFIKDYPISLLDKDGNPVYSAHPNDDTDVVAIQIVPKTLVSDKTIWGSFDLEDHALTLSQMQTTGVIEGSLVYTIGFPMNLVDDIKAPICRLGCISRIMDAFIRQNNECPTFLIDAQTFPGNSGSPVVSRPEQMSINGTPTNNSANLIGILSSYIPYEDTLISRQTGKARMIQTENSGLTVVHPVDRIKEVVELEWKRNSNTETVVTNS